MSNDIDTAAIRADLIGLDSAGKLVRVARGLCDALDAARARLAAAAEAHRYWCGCDGLPPHCDLLKAITGGST